MKFKETCGNEPLNRPGIYLLTNLINGKNYVGISVDLRRRVLSHLHSRPSAPVLFKALKKYGPEEFLVTPLYYSISGTDHLPELETEFIKEYRSTEHGYNVQQASGAVGPYGPEFGAILKEALSKPEAKQRQSAASKTRMTPAAREAVSERMKQLWSDPSWRDQMTQKIRIAHADPVCRSRKSVSIKAIQTPDFVAARTEKMKETVNTPEHKKRRSDVAKIIQNDPIIRSKLVEKMRATMATQEYKAKRSAASLAMQTPELKKKKSDSLKAAYANDPLFRERIAASKRGRIWITDGVNNRCIKPDVTVPEGWRRGKS